MSGPVVIDRLDCDFFPANRPDHYGEATRYICQANITWPGLRAAISTSAKSDVCAPARGVLGLGAKSPLAMILGLRLSLDSDGRTANRAQATSCGRGAWTAGTLPMRVWTFPLLLPQCAVLVRSERRLFP